MPNDSMTTPAPTLGTIALDARGLRSDLAIQQRAAMDRAKVDEYADLYRDGRDLGPLTLFLDAGEHCLWLADGFHRLEAARQAGLPSLPATPMLATSGPHSSMLWGPTRRTGCPAPMPTSARRS